MRGVKEVIVTSDSTGENYSAAVWDPTTASLLSTYKHASALGFHTLQLLGDSYLLAADAMKPSLHLWPLNSQNTVPNLHLSTPAKVTALASTPNGSYIAAGLKEKISVWQVCTGRLLATLAEHFQTVTCLVFNSDGTVFASGGEDGLIFIWSLAQVATGQLSPMQSFTVHSRAIKDLYFGKFGLKGRLCSVSADCTAKIFDACIGKVLLNVPCDAPLLSVTMDIIESRLFLGTANGKIIQINLHDPPRSIERFASTEQDNEKSVINAHDGGVVTLSVSVDCKTLVSGGTDGMVHIWDIPAREIIKTIKHKGPIVSAFFAKSLDNFRTRTLKPSVNVRPLQRTCDDSSQNAHLHVALKDDNISTLLNPDLYFSNQSTIVSSSENDSDKLKAALKEIENLKSVNAALYQYSVKNLLKKANVD